MICAYRPIYNKSVLLRIGVYIHTNDQWHLFRNVFHWDCIDTLGLRSLQFCACWWAIDAQSTALQTSAASAAHLAGTATKCPSLYYYSTHASEVTPPLQKVTQCHLSKWQDLVKDDTITYNKQRRNQDLKRDGVNLKCRTDLCKFKAHIGLY